MQSNRFGQISNLFGERRLSRRAALAQGAGLAAGGAAIVGMNAAAQDATPDASPVPSVTLPPNDDGVTNLFVQSFQTGSIAPSTSTFGTHTVTLEQGMGQTIIFADRPSRDVGAAPTPQFLDGLGFDADNPPNAAILMETGQGATDIAVVELFNPTYDEATHTATYDIAVLANWQNDLELGFQEAPIDLSELPASFGATHLFIDSCENRNVNCYLPNPDPYTRGPVVATFPGQKSCYWFSKLACNLCTPSDAQTDEDLERYWSQTCNNTFPACNNTCHSPY